MLLPACKSANYTSPFSCGKKKSNHAFTAFIIPELILHQLEVCLLCSGATLSSLKSPVNGELPHWNGFVRTTQNPLSEHFSLNHLEIFSEKRYEVTPQIKVHSSTQCDVMVLLYISSLWGKRGERQLLVGRLCFLFGYGAKAPPPSLS